MKGSRRLRRSRRGQATAIGAVLFFGLVVLMVAFIQETYQIQSRMEQLDTDRFQEYVTITSAYIDVNGHLVLNVTNRGGIMATLLRLWLINQTDNIVTKVDIDYNINPGASIYNVTKVVLTSGKNYEIRVVTARGNIASYNLVPSVRARISIIADSTVIIGNNMTAILCITNNDTSGNNIYNLVPKLTVSPSNSLILKEGPTPSSIKLLPPESTAYFRYVYNVTGLGRVATLNGTFVNAPKGNYETYTVYATNITAAAGAGAVETFEISNALLGGVNYNYPVSTTPTGLESISKLQSIDQSYFPIGSGQQGVINEFPVKNMNFTGDEDGWFFYMTSGAVGVTSGFLQSEGCPSPSSGQGSIYAGLQGSSLGPYWLNWTYYFTYSGQQPESAYFGWGRKADLLVAMSMSKIYVTLYRPSPLSSINITSPTVDLTTPDYQTWFYQGNLPIDKTYFATPGNYRLEIALKASTNPNGKIRMLFDDVGIMLSCGRVWSSDWYGTFKLNETATDIEKLKLTYTGHYTIGTQPNNYSPSSGTLLGGTTTVDGSYANLANNDASFWQLRSYGTSSPNVDPKNPTSYNLLGNTTWVSGTVSSLTANDGSYLIFNSYPRLSVSTYNPLSYTLKGGTKLVSGSVIDLTSRNTVNMTFSSYPSSFSTTSKTNATIAYRSNIGTSTPQLEFPKTQTWDGSAWSGESEMSSTGSPVRTVRVEYSTNSSRYYEKIVVTLSDDGYLDAYVWTGSSWSVTNNIGFVGTTANAYRPFDIAYSTTRGRAFLVYGVSSTDTTKDLAYRIWDGTQWSSEAYIDDNSVTGHLSEDIQVYWVCLASKPTSGSNEIALLYIDGTNSDVDAFIWDGTAWGNRHELTATVSITTEESLALAYEQTSGNLMIVAGETTLIRWNRWTGTAWGTSTTFDINTGAAGTMNWLSLRVDPVSNRMILVSVDAATDLCTARWDGSAWTVDTPHDAAVDTHASRCADAAFEPSESKILLVWGTAAASVSYKTWTPAGGWSGITTPANAGTHPWIQLRRNPRDVTGSTARIFGATLNSAFDLFIFRWGDSTLTFEASAFTTDTVVSTYECFDIGYSKFGNPTQYTSEVEFSGTSNLENWLKLTWRVGSAWTTDSVTVTLQLYNFFNSQYPSSGNGFISYTSSAIANSYEEKVQEITVNPLYYQDYSPSAGWKVKVKGVKATSSPFNFKVDWIEYKPAWAIGYTSAVEFLGTTNNYTWADLQWSIDSAWDKGSIPVIIQVWNYSLNNWSPKGNGYLTYNSSATPNTDELKTQTITIKPEDFRNSSGNWRIKVTGNVTVATQFSFKVDWIEYKPKHYTEYTSDWTGQFTVTGLPSNPALAISYWGYYNTETVTQSMLIWNFTSNTWETLGLSPIYQPKNVGQYQNRTVTMGIASLISGGNITIRIRGYSVTPSQFNTYANFLRLTVYTMDVATQVSQTMYIWDFKENQWHKISNITNRGVDPTQGPFELTESLERYVSPTREAKIRILGESNGMLIKCFADYLLLEDYYRDRTKLTVVITNTGSSSIDLVALWIINSTYKEQIAINPAVTLEPGKTYTYRITGRYFSPYIYYINVVTQKGNIEDYTIPYTD